MAGIITGVVVGQSGVTLMARILGNSGTPITQSDISTIAYTIRNLTLGTTPVTSTSLTVSSVVFNALQQSDQRWTADSQYAPGTDRRWGYNFLATLPAASFADLFAVDSASPFDVTPYKVQVSVVFTPASGQPFRQVFQFTPIPTW